MLNLAFLGAWHVHFEEYASQFAARPDCRIAAVWDTDPVRGQAAAAQFGCEFVADYRELLARDDIGGVAVTSETSLHPELLLAAARAGKHIYTEKVLCFTEREAEEIREAVHENGVKFCISLPKRTRAEYLYIKNAVKTGLLGRISYARVRVSHDGASSAWLPAYFYDPALCGGGAMIDLGAHPMCMLADLFGLPDAVTSFFTHVSGKPVEDNAVSMLEYGAMLASSETGFVSKAYPSVLELTGSKGTLIWGGPREELTVDLGEGPFLPALPDPLKCAADQWADAVLYGGEIAFGIDDAVDLTVMMEKAYLSAREGRKIAFLR